MVESVLLVNPGSTSRKYEYYKNGTKLVDFHFENLSDGSVQESISYQGQNKVIAHPTGYLDNALAKVRDFLVGHGNDVDRVGVRVVAPGKMCSQHQKITTEYLKGLEKCSSMAPLHAPVMLREIRLIQDVFSQVDIFAVSDSAFHATVPDFVSMISVSRLDRDSLGIQKYGYHGLSCSSIVRQLNQQGIESVNRTVVIHLGGGISVMAVDANQSLATSMGFTPGSGVVMSSRGGDISAGSMLALMKERDMSTDQAYDYLYRQSGLRGICGESDLRVIMDRIHDGDSDAILTLDTLRFQIQSYVAAYAVLMGGLDRIVLTATALERNGELRASLMQGLDLLGVDIDVYMNEAVDADGGVISSQDSAVEIMVVPTQESLEMYHTCIKL